MSQAEPHLSPGYAKDPVEEAFLERINAILAPSEREEYADLPEQFPTLHVIGVPRSGTTLLYQLIASHLSVAYIDHLVAAFWRAPVYGIRLSRKLIPHTFRSTLESNFGRTNGIEEPHEFGYFWRDLIGYHVTRVPSEDSAERIDWARVRRVLINMTHAAGAPIAFKSFGLAWHLRTMQEVLPATCFVWIRRDPVQTAISLLKLREEFLGGRDRWASVRPPEYPWLIRRPVWEQVAGQVFYIERAIRRQVELVGGRNVLEVSYERLSEDPRAILTMIRDLVSANGPAVELTGVPPRNLECHQVSSEDDDFVRIRDAFQKVQSEECTRAE